MWLVTSLVGPVYAGWITSVLSWRWALVLYLPLLVVARIVISRQLRGTMQSNEQRERLMIGAALILAGGVGLLSVVGLPAVPVALAGVLGIAGAITAALAARRLLPRGTLRAAPGRPAAIATMGVLTAAYFGASSIIAIVVHDVLDGSATQVALVLAGGGLGWAVTGFAVSRWPARAPGPYVRRTTWGAVLIALGLVVVTTPLLTATLTLDVQMVLLGWTIAGIGMGLVYLDTLNQIVDVPVAADGISVPRAGAAAILVEAIATAVTTTTAAALVGRAVASGEGAASAAAVLGGVALLCLLIVAVARRVPRSRADDEPTPAEQDVAHPQP